MLLRRTIFENLPYLIRRFTSEHPAFEEIKIPVPWGHIAGKWWGPQDKRPILCCHGWQDNCGSFDTLIPLLPSHVGYLAIDFPGHGYSTHLPPGAFYHPIESVITLKRVVDYFNWPKVSFLGHSLGSINNYHYATLYPESVDFMICLDIFTTPTYEKKKAEHMVSSIKEFLKYDRLNDCEKREPPCYNFNDLEKLLHEGTQKSIDIKSCKYILNRNAAKSTKEENKYYFTRDMRLKAIMLATWTQQEAVEEAKRITCPMFVSKGTRTIFFENKKGTIEMVEVMKKINRNFEYHFVEGTHHVHLNNPKCLAGLISAFINKYDIADRSIGGFTSDIKI